MWIDSDGRWSSNVVRTQIDRIARDQNRDLIVIQSRRWRVHGTLVRMIAHSRARRRRRSASLLFVVWRVPVALVLSRIVANVRVIWVEIRVIGIDGIVRDTIERWTHRVSPVHERPHVNRRESTADERRPTSRRWRNGRETCGWYVPWQIGGKCDTITGARRRSHDGRVVSVDARVPYSDTKFLFVDA